MISRADFRRGNGGELWACRCLWLVSFVACLPVAVIAQLTGWRWKPWDSGLEGYGSAIHEADAVANTIVELSFSGL